jgi:TP901 family phage tail tape measure protein
MVMIAGNNAPLMGSLGQSEAALRGFSSTTGTHTGTASNHLTGVGIAALGVVGAVGIMSAAGVSAAADFQDRMAIINTIAHQTPQELNTTGESLRNMASQTGASLTDLTGGFYDLLSAGVSSGNAMEFLRNATTLSIGGLSTVGESVDAITTATNAWSAAGGRAHLTQKDSALVADVFAKAIERGKVTADQISSSLANVASTAASMNIPIQEVGAVYATLTARGIPAAEATQRLNGALVALQRIPPGMQELQDKTHKSYEEIARTQGVQSAFQQLRTDADRYHISLIDVMGRQDAMAFVLNVTGAAGRQFSSDLSSMYDATGTASSQAEERMGTFNRTTGRLGETVNSALISLGSSLLPTLSVIAEHVAEAVYGFTLWSNANPGLASNILLVAGAVAAVVAGVVFLGPILGAIGTAIGVITSPITLLIAAIVVLASYFGLLGEGARGMADSAVAAFAGFASTALGALQGFADQALSWLSAQVPVLLAQLGAWGQAFVDWISPMVSPALAALGGFASQIIAWISAQAPGWLAQLNQWANAFVAWVGPMIPPLLAALGDLASQVAAWIVAQAPGWLSQLSTLAGAFVDWISPMIPPLLAALGDLVSQALAWVSAQVPGLVAAAQQWAGAFIDWVTPIAGQLVARLGDFITALIGWVNTQIPVVAAAALPIGGAIVDAILGAVAGLAGTLGGALGNAVTNMDVGQLATDFQNILNGAGIIAAVVIAGQVVGAAYAAAVRTAAAAIDTVGSAISGAFQTQQAAIASAVGAVGSAVGAAFATAFRIGATALGAVSGGIAAAFGALAAPLAAAMSPVGTAAGAALDGAVALGAAIGVPLLIGTLIVGIGTAIALAINQTFPGLAQAMAQNFARGVFVVQQFVANVSRWLGTLPGAIAGVFGQVGAFLAGLPAQFFAWASNIGKAVFDGIMAGLGNVGQAVNQKLSEIPGVKLGGDIGANLGAGWNEVAKNLPHFDLGGVVPGSGPQLVVAHGGETITPVGRAGGAPISHTTHVVLQLDGTTIAEHVERRIFNNAEGATSGFAGSPVLLD